MASLLGRATVYRLVGIAPTLDAIFNATAAGRLAESGMDFVLMELAGAPGILYFRQHPTTDTSWCARLSQLCGVTLDLTRHDSEALLIVAVGEYVYAVGFGRGYRAIIDAIEPGFGLRCALRLIDPLQVQGVVRRAMGGVPRQDSTFVPSGIPIEGIGVVAHAELVEKLAQGRSYWPSCSRARS